MRFLPLVLIGLVLMANSPGLCQSVTLRANGSTLGSALDAVFKDSGKTYCLDAKVDPGIVLGDISIVDAPFDIALRSILRTRHFSFKADGQTYTILAGGVGPSQAANSTPPLQPAEQPTGKTLKIGMTSSEVKGLLGQPKCVDATSISGTDIYYYDDQVIKFKHDCVSAIEARVPTSVRLKPSNGTTTRPRTAAYGSAYRPGSVPAANTYAASRIPAAAMTEPKLHTCFIRSISYGSVKSADIT